MVILFLQKNTILKKDFAAEWVVCIVHTIMKMFRSPGARYCFHRRINKTGNFLLAVNIDVKTAFTKVLPFIRFQEMAQSLY